MVREPIMRLTAATPPVVLIVAAWASLELDPDLRSFAPVAVAALLCALPRTALRRAGLAAVVLAVSALAFAGPAPDALGETTRVGLREVFSVTPPVDAHLTHDLHVLMVLTAGAFALGVAVVADSRPFVAAAVAAIGVGWPVALQPSRNTIITGTILLLAALWPVVVGSTRDRGGIVPGLAAIMIVAVGAAVVAGAGARPSTAALDWENWDLFSGDRARATVALVWDANYSGIDFPGRKTTVLRIEAPRRALYWRATTLDTFSGDRWVETLAGTTAVASTATLPFDPLLPAASARRPEWVEQRVEVHALVDDHIIAVGQPMSIDADQATQVRVSSGGILKTVPGQGAVRRYTVWSYVAQPSPAELVRSAPTYPAALDRYLDIGRAVVPAFGAPGRGRAVDGLFTDDLYQPLWLYKPLWQEAQRLTAGAQSPYAATLSIERWLRSDGGFTYDEHPPPPAGLPALTDFVVRTKRGYCQHFAGAMTLMLRYLGIPARVAVGFSNGSWKDGAWTVTDHDAHAWVEAWFAGYGWLAFDPTPARGTLTAAYTNASDSADAIRALRNGPFLGAASTAPRASARTPRIDRAAPDKGFNSLLLSPLAAAFAVVGAVALGKARRRRRRYATADPRLRAAAARAELADFVRDQGAPLSPAASVRELELELRRHGVGSDAFAAAFARARYGPLPGAGDAAADTKRELTRILALLRGRLGTGRRVRGFFALRSLRDG